MIRRVSIRNYRSCLDTEFDLHQRLSVLIGPNSSGKTNVLSAILLLRKLVEESSRFPYHVARPTGSCEVKAWFDISGKTAILTAGLDLDTDEHNNDVILGSHQSWYAKDFTGDGKRLDLPLALFSRHWSKTGVRYYYRREGTRVVRSPVPIEVLPAASQAIETVAHELEDMRYYSASQFTDPGRCPVSFEVERNEAADSEARYRGHAKLLRDLYRCSKAEDPSAYEQYFEIIGPKGIRLVDEMVFSEIPTSSVDFVVRAGGEVSQRSREKTLVVPRFRVGRNYLSPNQLSEGTFKTLTLLFYLVTQPSRVLLIEEPEVCVHHGLLATIVELIRLYSADRQIIVTTHSDFVLDRVEPENVYAVTNTPEAGTRVTGIARSMSKGELSALRAYLETEGNLGEYWRHGGLDR